MWKKNKIPETHSLLFSLIMTINKVENSVFEKADFQDELFKMQKEVGPTLACCSANGLNFFQHPPGEAGTGLE